MKQRCVLGSFLAAMALTQGCTVFHASVTRSYREALAAGPYDVLIVPGFPSRNGQWNRVIQARVYWSHELLAQGVARYVIYSGAAVRTPYVEAQVMALYARAIGVPQEMIFTETNALHSCENLYYSYQLARRLGFEKVAVVSDPTQMFRLRRVAREFALPVAFLPVDFLELSRIPTLKPKLDPSTAYVEGFVPLHKRMTRREIRQASAGARIRAERAATRSAEASSKSPSP